MSREDRPVSLEASNSLSYSTVHGPSCGLISQHCLLCSLMHMAILFAKSFFFYFVCLLATVLFFVVVPTFGENAVGTFILRASNIYVSSSFHIYTAHIRYEKHFS